MDVCEVMSIPAATAIALSRSGVEVADAILTVDWVGNSRDSTELVAVAELRATEAAASTCAASPRTTRSLVSDCMATVAAI